MQLLIESFSDFLIKTSYVQLIYIVIEQWLKVLHIDWINAAELSVTTIGATASLFLNSKPARPAAVAL